MGVGVLGVVTIKWAALSESRAVSKKFHITMVLGSQKAGFHKAWWVKQNLPESYSAVLCSHPLGVPPNLFSIRKDTYEFTGTGGPF